MNWKIGDKVRLTGREWPTDKGNSVRWGTEHTVTSVDHRGNVRLSGWGGEYHWAVRKDWEIELVERKDSVMSVDFSDVNVGDKVRLTRENGDETTFEVEEVWTNSIRSASNSFQGSSWDTLEIVERAFKPVPGLYSNPRTGDRAVVQRNLEAYYAAAGGRWIQANVGSGNVGSAVREKHGWRREITF